MPPLSLPTGYSRIKVVHSFHELITTPFAGEINALCWPRSLPGDFHEVANHLVVNPGINAVDEGLLQELPLSEAGRTAVRVMQEDLERLRAHDLLPELNCIAGFVREAEEAPMRTDVYSFHADSATVEADTWLCTYLGASSEGLRNEEAIRRVEIPETRAELLKLYGGEDDEDFLTYLNENFYDLHYTCLPEAVPFTFGVGHLWRIAVEYPGCPVPPCIHRAPLTAPGEQRRLLLIS